MIQWLKNLFTRKDPSLEFNYLYFSLGFLFIAFLSVIQIFSKEEGSLGVKIFFTLYSAGQALLEISCLAFLGLWIRKKFSKILYKIFIGITFLFFLGHFVDFIMSRLMDASILYAFKLFFAEGISHFFAAIFALNMNVKILFIILGAIFCIPIIGIFFYWFTRKLIQKVPVILKPFHLFLFAAALGLGLLGLDMGILHKIAAKTHSHLKKNLPLGATFLTPTGFTLQLPGTFKEPRKEEEIMDTLKQKSFVANKRPNIYLFVIETFRKDYVSSDITPNLHLFSKEQLSFPLSLANANASHYSWFSIFHSVLPYHWAELKKKWQGGSIPIRILKSLGYKTHVFSSAELSYYNMQELLFGKTKALIDDYQEFSSDRKLSAADKDLLTWKALRQALMEKEGQYGNLYIVFLDATHSEYHWPKDFPTPFTPFVENIDYLSMATTKKELEMVKNRYKNALYFVDYQIGAFLKQLQDNNLYTESVIAFTGDHGEEFFEQGAMFHATHLNEAQISVPIFYKLGEIKTGIGHMTSHIDILPTIIHYLTGRDDFSDLFDGQSVLSDKRWPYIFTVQQNGGETPIEFSLHDGTYRIHAKFENPKTLYTSSTIKVLGIYDRNETTMEPGSYSQVTESFIKALYPLTTLRDL